MLPITYAIRNLFRDPGRLFQTVAGSALVVLLVIAAIALNHGMEEVLQTSGSSTNVILVGAGSEESVERSEVHLDAEAADLVRLQQAFEANSRVIQVAAELFDTILGLR